MHKYKKAFTLAEIIVVLTLLGVVAAITIPNALDNSSKKSNVVRIKKALPVFERAIEQMRIANNLTNMEELVNYANEGGECANIRKEFKIKKYSDEENASKCIFQTNDGVWWNLSNIEKPIISPLKDGYKYLTATYANKPLTNEEGKNAFYLTLMQGDGSLGYAFLANDPNHELDDNKCDIKKTLVYAKIMDENELCSDKEENKQICDQPEDKNSYIAVSTEPYISYFYVNGCRYTGKVKWVSEWNDYCAPNGIGIYGSEKVYAVGDDGSEQLIESPSIYTNGCDKYKGKISITEAIFANGEHQEGKEVAVQDKQ